MTVPGPGWHVDPQDPTVLRWWSGESWTEHKQPRPPTESDSSPDGSSPTVGKPYVPMAGYYRDESVAVAEPLTRKEKDRQIRRNNSFAYTGLVLALVGFIFNPFAIPSVLGVVFSSIGLARANSLDGRLKITGRGTAIAGIIVGLLGIAAFSWALSRQIA